MNATPLRAVLALIIVSLPALACATSRTELTEGSSGLSSAIPGGDGRALAAYDAEFNANAVAGMDTLMLRTQEVWRRDNRTELASLFYRTASLVTPDGHLVFGHEAARDWVGAQLPVTASRDFWRDEYGASGLMTYMYGRYEADSNQPDGDNRGVHLTIAMRDRFTWKVRSRMYLAFDGSVPVTAPALLTPEPPHVSPDSIRASIERGGVAGWRRRAEWAVESYLSMNSLLSQWRFGWNQDDRVALTDMLADGAIVRVPWDVPAIGKTNAAYSIERLLPAVGDLHMSILDFDSSERLAFALGRYTLDAGGQVLSGYYTAVALYESGGPVIRALVFSGAGANQAATERVPRLH